MKMGFFNRKPRGDGPVADNHHTSRRERRHGAARDNSYRESSMMKRPSFGQWLKVTWKDIVTFIIMGALGLGIYEAHPAPTRSFAVTFSDGEIVYPEFAYPLRKEIVPIWLAALLASIIPIFIILVMQIRVRSFWDANNGILGLLYSLITAAVFQVFLKWLIGGLRPHFLSVCKPDISLAKNGNGVLGSPYNAAGFKEIYYTREICTGDLNTIDDSLESFPSGHTTAAFAGFVYLYLYLNAKLKVFANYHPAMWKLVVIYIPILGAVLIGGALTIDAFHNWYDIIAGALIGTTMAFSAYRMLYASIWDWRFNHIPLNRYQPFAYSMGDVELADALFTRKAGWGSGGGGMGAGGQGNGKFTPHGGVMGHGHDHGYNGTMGSDGYARDGVSGSGNGVSRKAVPSRGDDMV
ncbi:acid phosphatase/Vanadium-dependent haloperoxidase [Xylariaceae sp. FL0255]|nr:acid phosphatase/Vanadium-dependent haloperoxidase [Xylariaceae sp. FL0255]